MANNFGNNWQWMTFVGPNWCHSTLIPQERWRLPEDSLPSLLWSLPLNTAHVGLMLWTQPQNSSTNRVPGTMGHVSTHKLVSSPKIISWFILALLLLSPCYLIKATDQTFQRPRLTQRRTRWQILPRILLSAARRDFMGEGAGSVSWFVYFWSNVYSSCLYWKLLEVLTFRQKHHEISTVIQFITGFMGGIAVHLCYKMWLQKGQLC